MSNYNSLKATIDANIKQNGNQEITGQILNSVLNQMVNILGTGYQFAGVATLDPATDPGTPDAKVFYIANGKGTYTNFGGLEVTEDDVVVLYWDTAWHKVSTGIATQAKVSELEGKVNGKQDALTLTIKDNGNIVIGNIHGQTKEFMPATPSGDPMHYAYVAAGAEWNGTGADIVKTTPWADLADDDADKTVVHKAGYWYLNGLGDITNDEIRRIYQLTSAYPEATNLAERFRGSKIRTNFYKVGELGGYAEVNTTAMLLSSSLVVVRGSLISIGQSSFMFDGSRVRHYVDNLSILRSPYGISSDYLITIRLFHLTINIKINCPHLSVKSVLYAINNEKATSPITITLHADAYARAMANADIVAALEAHPNVSLASA